MDAGSYLLTARMVVQHRGNREAIERGHFAVGLLTCAPTPEGTHVHELKAEGYERQPVEFLDLPKGPGAHAVRNSNCVVFKDVTPSWPKASHAAIFDANGDLFAYSWLQSSAGFTGHNEITLAPTAIKLRLN
jgi:hypothetical protein